jgi:hypothetical protein
MPLKRGVEKDPRPDPGKGADRQFPLHHQDHQPPLSYGKSFRFNHQKGKVGANSFSRLQFPRLHFPRLDA